MTIVAAHTCNHNTWQAEAVLGSRSGQPQPHSETLSQKEKHNLKIQTLPLNSASDQLFGELRRINTAWQRLLNHLQLRNTTVILFWT